MALAIFPHELIGEEIEVFHSRNPNDQGLRGRIADETKATLVLECQGQRKRLLKHNLIIRLLRTGKIIAGNRILRRAEERIKR